MRFRGKLVEFREDGKERVGFEDAVEEVVGAPETPADYLEDEGVEEEIADYTLCQQLTKYPRGRGERGEGTERLACFGNFVILQPYSILLELLMGVAAAAESGNFEFGTERGERWGVGWGFGVEGVEFGTQLVEGGGVFGFVVVVVVAVVAVDEAAGVELRRGCCVLRVVVEGAFAGHVHGGVGGVHLV